VLLEDESWEGRSTHHVAGDGVVEALVIRAEGCRKSASGDLLHGLGPLAFQQTHFLLLLE